MNEVLVRIGPAPLHEQISDLILQRIVAGDWPSHYKLPAEPQLAVQFEVSRGTIRRALKTLIDQGLLLQVQGKGTFVATSTTIEQPIAQEMLSLAEGLSRQGLAFTTEVIESGFVVPPERVAALMEVRGRARVFRLLRRRSVRGVWVALLANFVRADLCPDIERHDFERQTLFGTLEDSYGLRLEWARRTFEAQAANEDVARRLELGQGSPVLYLEQVSYLSDDTPVEYSDVWIRGDSLRISSLLKRPSTTEESPASLTQP